MRLAIPSPPRPVRLGQVPGAVRRLALTAAAAAAAVAALWALGAWAGRSLSTEAAFFVRAVEVKGQLSHVGLPPAEKRAGGTARLTVLYPWEGRQLTGTGVEADAEAAEGLAPGALVTLLVDPQAPSRPREAARARRLAGLRPLGWGGLGAGLVVAVLLLAREGRRAVRRELQPLRLGALVWLTPDGPLPDTKDELTFPASYWRDDRELRVTARARPGRAPVRNGEKVLAAVVPAEPTWVRVVDEELARTLGWFAD